MQSYLLQSVEGVTAPVRFYPLACQDRISILLLKGQISSTNQRRLHVNHHGGIELLLIKLILKFSCGTIAVIDPEGTWRRLQNPEWNTLIASPERTERPQEHAIFSMNLARFKVFSNTQVLCRSFRECGIQPTRRYKYTSSSDPEMLSLPARVNVQFQCFAATGKKARFRL